MTSLFESICLTPIFPSESSVKEEGGIKCASTFFVGINNSAVIPSLISKFELLISSSILKVLVLLSAVLET